MARRHDSQALINAHDMRNFREIVVAPAIRQLQPIPRELIGGTKGFRTQTARDNSHNSVCYEMRLSFALSIGAAFERNLRLWLSLRQKELRPKIERANRTCLFNFVSELKGSNAAVRLQATELLELWELVSAARHGDGAAAKRLRSLNPKLWSRHDRITQNAYDRVGLRGYSLRVQDLDLERYFDARIGFWDSAS